MLILPKTEGLAVNTNPQTWILLSPSCTWSYFRGVVVLILLLKWNELTLVSCQILWIFTLRGTWSDRTLTEEGTTSGNYMLIVHSVVCYMCFSSCKPDLDPTMDLQITAGLCLLLESIRRVKCSTGSQCREVWDKKVPWAELCMDETNNRHTLPHPVWQTSPVWLWTSDTGLCLQMLLRSGFSRAFLGCTLHGNDKYCEYLTWFPYESQWSVIK